MYRTFLALLLALCSCASYRDYRGIIHCHSKYSHDSEGTYEEILAAAKSAKVDFVIMTDHPPKDDPGLPLREGWRGVHDGVLFIQGAELGSQILAIGIREPVTASGRQAKIDAIHAQGGLAFIAHPEEVTTWDSFTGFDGMEIYNVHAAFKKHQRDAKFIAAAMKQLKEDPEHLFLMLCETDEAILARWRTLKVSGIAGNDAHQNVNILGVQVDPYVRNFRFVSTHVYAKELTEEAILEALKAGRCYVAFDLIGNPKELDHEPTREFRGKRYPWILK